MLFLDHPASQPYRREYARKPPLVVILGPTAVGKTEIAIQLAERLDGEIVSADSRLFYRGMDIGTAKPGISERSRVPHYLIDIAEPDQIWSLGLFQSAARKAIATIHERKRLPFLVGGTGQYIRAVTEGWVIPQVSPDLRLRKVLESWGHQVGPLEMHNRLSRLDPQAAASIDPQNLRRTVRALEVILKTGKRFSEQKKRLDSPYRLLLLGLARPRSELYARVDARIEQMIDTGFVEEVKGLLAAGYAPELPTLSAIGYREMIEYLEGKISLEQAKTSMKRRTRIFIRRQANWFKTNDPHITWSQVNAQVVDKLIDHIRNWGIISMDMGAKKNEVHSLKIIDN